MLKEDDDLLFKKLGAGPFLTKNRAGSNASDKNGSKHVKVCLNTPFLLLIVWDNKEC